MANKLTMESRSALMTEQLVEHLSALWPPGGTTDLSLSLSAAAEGMVNTWRAEGMSPRTDLLVFVAEGGEIRKDLYTSEGLKDLHAILAERIADNTNEVTCVLAATLVAVQSAMFDSNWVGVSSVLSWATRKLGEGASLDDFLVLEIAKVYSQFGTARQTSAKPSQPINVPSLDAILRLWEDINHVMSIPDDSLKLGLRLLLKLVESVQLIPAARLQSDCSDYARWVIDICEPHIDSPPGTSDQMNARLSIVVSEMHYALNDLDQARACAMRALQTTSGTDLPFVHRCLNHLSFLELEQASRKANLDRITDAVVDSAEEKMQGIMRDTTKDLKDELKEEIKDALLRVVEVLGIFIGIVSIAIASVGGIAAGRDALQTLIIFGTGFGSIVLLVVVLRWIVHDKPPITLQKAKAQQADGSMQPAKEEELGSAGDLGGQHPAGSAERSAKAKQLDGAEYRDNDARDGAAA